MTHWHADMQSDQDKFHLNGNALYSLQSAAFRKFMRDTKKLFDQGNDAFDCAMHQWRTELNNFVGHSCEPNPNGIPVSITLMAFL